jgi:7-keto-8-aminopelargonate synthetase-like enzyme
MVAAHGNAALSLRIRADRRRCGRDEEGQTGAQTAAYLAQRAAANVKRARCGAIIAAPSPPPDIAALEVAAAADARRREEEQVRQREGPQWRRELQQHRSVEVREEDDHPIVWRQPIVLTMEAGIASSGAVSLARALG